MLGLDRTLHLSIWSWESPGFAVSRDSNGEVGENRRLQGLVLMVEDVDAILPVGGALGKLEE